MIGKLLNDNGIVAENVEVTMAPDYRREDGVTGWHGEAWLSTEVQVLPGHEMTLVLQDGAQYPIVVDRVIVDSRKGKMQVRFTGTGTPGSAWKNS